MKEKIDQQIVTVFANIFSLPRLITILSRDKAVFDRFVKLLGYLKFFETKNQVKDPYYKKFAQALADVVGKSFSINEYDNVVEIDAQASLNGLVLIYFNLYNEKKDLFWKPVNNVDAVLKNKVSLDSSAFIPPATSDNNIPFMPKGNNQPASPFSFINNNNFYPYYTKPKQMPLIKHLFGIFLALFTALYLIGEAVAIYSGGSKAILSAHSSTHYTSVFVLDIILSLSMFLIVYAMFRKPRNLVEKFRVSMLYLIFPYFVALAYFISGSLYILNPLIGNYNSSAIAPIIIISLAFLCGLAMLIISFYIIKINPKLDREKLMKAYEEHAKNMHDMMNNSNNQDNNFNNRFPPNNFNNSFQQNIPTDKREHHNVSDYQKKDVKKNDDADKKNKS